jgi:hypothetical protein
MNDWQKVIDAKPGDIMWEYYDPDNDIRGYVLRGPGALCGYIGTKADHPLWAHSGYRNPLNTRAPYEAFDWIPVHAGMTYGGSLEGTQAHNPEYHFIGWDYAHAGDECVYDYYSKFPIPGHKWTVPEVADYVRSALVVFTNYKKLIDKLTGGLCDEKAVELFKKLEE